MNSIADLHHDLSTRLWPTFLTLLMAASLSACTTLKTPLKKGPKGPARVARPDVPYWGEIDLVWPLRDWRFSRGYKPKEGRKRAHRGVDLAATRGSDILAAHEGMIIYAGRDFRGFGKLVIVENEAWATFYSHCSKIFVKEGETVKQGQVIAAVGSTGRSTGPHLHFELRRDRMALDPLPFLEDSPVINGQVRNDTGDDRGPAGRAQP